GTTRTGATRARTARARTARARIHIVPVARPGIPAIDRIVIDPRVRRRCRIEHAPRRREHDRSQGMTEKPHEPSPSQAPCRTQLADHARHARDRATRLLRFATNVALVIVERSVAFHSIMPLMDGLEVFHSQIHGYGVRTLRPFKEG